MNPFLNSLIEPLTLRLPSDDLVGVPRCRRVFMRWQGEPIADTYGGKAVLNFFDEPMFAELAILGTLRKAGWDGVWVDTYRNKFRQALAPHCCDLPSHAQRLYDRIQETNGGKRSGCFDVFAWNDGRYLFVEAKRKAKDSIRETQKAWIQAALNVGVAIDSLLICEWDLGFWDNTSDALKSARWGMFRGDVVSIHVAATTGIPMESHQHVEAIAGRGLEGDRYFDGTGHWSNSSGVSREITLIEIESIEALAREKNIEITPGAARRNLVTRGVPLNHLVGREFRVGGVRLRGTRLCEPCQYLEGLTTKGVLAGLIHRGGLRADIVSGGTIRVGDLVTESKNSE